MKLQGKHLIILMIFLSATVGTLIWQLADSGAFGLGGPGTDTGSDDLGTRSSIRENRGRANRSLADRPRDRLMSMEQYLGSLVGIGIERQRIEDYVESQGRSRDALIGAGIFGANGTPWLLEAMEKYPDDPMVQFIAVTRDLADEDQRADWLARLKKSQPDNALVSYLEAAFYFQKGELERGLESLRRSAGQSEYRDFGSTTVDLGEKMFLGLGESEDQASIGVLTGLDMPQIGKLSAISEALTGSELGGNRTVPAVESLLLGIQMGQHIREGGGIGTLLNRAVGASMMKSFAQELDPGTSIPEMGISSAQLLQELDSDLQRLGEMTGALGSGSYPRSIVMEYFRRVRADGEIEAIEWLEENVPESSEHQ